jgi:hypothetical protein
MRHDEESSGEEKMITANDTAEASHGFVKYLFR